MNVTAVGGINAGLNSRAATFARSTVYEIIGRPHVYVFNQYRLIPPNIDLHMKLMLSPNNIVCKSAAPANNAVQENFKLVIQNVNLIIHTKQLTRTALKAHMELLHLQNMRHHFSRVPNKAPVHPREPDVYHHRQRVYRRPSTPGHCWSGERRRPRRRLPEEPIQFPKFLREPHRAETQSHVGAARRLYPEFYERAVFNIVHDFPPGARVRHWR